MGMPELPKAIGFPAGMLGAVALRVPVIAAGEGWVALDKPAGVALEDHPWQDGAPTLLGGIRTQLDAGKPEMLRLGLAEPGVVLGPDVEFSGVTLLADRATCLAAWREALGSGGFTLTYEMIARGDDAPEEGGLCDLPLRLDETRRSTVVSHKRGKQSETRFAPGERAGAWRLWTATCSLARRDQVQVHANECGIRIAGELRYGRAGFVSLAETVSHGRLNKGGDRALHRSILLRLASVEGSVGGTPFRIEAPRTDDFVVTLRRLRGPTQQGPA
jgi:23S rRNA-/tRNA-specific pseudouridylate synthase